MKKVFLAVALMAVVAVSCKKANEEMSKIDAPVDTTTAVVDSVAVDTTAVAVDSVAVSK